MPLYRFAKLSSTSFYLIWRTEESLEALRAQLCPFFLADFHSLHLSAQDKIGQSLAVRIALYHLLKQLGLPITSLTKNEGGKPLLSDHSGYISFTHTRYFSAVALSTASPIGIDIEMVQPSLQRIQRRFLTEEEAQSANHCLTKLAIYWSAKEALYKRLDEQTRFAFQDVCIEPFPLETQGKLIAHLNKEKYGMGYEQIVETALPPHILVYCNG